METELLCGFSWICVRQWCSDCVNNMCWVLPEFSSTCNVKWMVWVIEIFSSISGDCLVERFPHLIDKWIRVQLTDCLERVILKFFKDLSQFNQAHQCLASCWLNSGWMVHPWIHQALNDKMINKRHSPPLCIQLHVNSSVHVNGSFPFTDHV